MQKKTPFVGGVWIFSKTAQLKINIIINLGIATGYVTLTIQKCSIAHVTNMEQTLDCSW